jgi:hypothetical protein
MFRSPSATILRVYSRILRVQQKVQILEILATYKFLLYYLILYPLWIVAEGDRNM